MTTTFATDAQLRTRSTLADEALVAINARRTVRTAAGAVPATFDEYRGEAQRQILVALRNREPSVTEADITRPDDLIESECCLTMALLCEAATQRGTTSQQQTPDLFGQEALRWRGLYEIALAAASPIDGVRGRGASFPWSRG